MSTTTALSRDQLETFELAGWRCGTFELHFPKRFTLWMQALRLLPDRLFFALVRRVTQ